MTDRKTKRNSSGTKKDSLEIELSKIETLYHISAIAFNWLKRWIHRKKKRDQVKSHFLRSLHKSRSVIKTDDVEAYGSSPTQEKSNSGKVTKTNSPIKIRYNSPFMKLKANKPTWGANSNSIAELMQEPVTEEHGTTSQPVKLVSETDFDQMHNSNNSPQKQNRVKLIWKLKDVSSQPEDAEQEVAVQVVSSTALPK